MPDQRTARRLEQLDASFRALGCDGWQTWWDRIDGLTHCRASWHDDNGGPPIVVHLTSQESSIAIIPLVGMEMSRRLAEERPELEFPDVVWT